MRFDEDRGTRGALLRAAFVLEGNNRTDFGGVGSGDFEACTALLLDLNGVMTCADHDSLCLLKDFGFKDCALVGSTFDDGKCTSAASE